MVAPERGRFRSRVCIVHERAWTGIALNSNLRVEHRLDWTSRGSTMAMQDPQAEPFMEEILASIRRIISEEEQPASEPVLDLTEHEPAVASTDEDDIVFEAVEQAVAAAPAPAPTMTHMPAPVETPPAPPEPTILS